MSRDIVDHSRDIVDLRHSCNPDYICQARDLTSVFGVTLN